MNFFDGRPTWYEVRNTLVPEFDETDVAQLLADEYIDKLLILTKKYRKAQLVCCQTQGPVLSTAMCWYDSA